MVAAYEQRPISVEDFSRIEEAGVFAPEERVELLDGKLIALPQVGPRHAGAVTRLTHLLMSRLGDRALVRVRLPALIDDYSEPLPDLLVTRVEQDYFSSRHPSATDVLLLIEVADTSLAYDQDKKLPTYARDGIAEVWIVDLKANRLLVYRDPRGDQYESTIVLHPKEMLAPLAFPDIQLAVADIVGEPRLIS